MNDSGGRPSSAAAPAATADGPHTTRRSRMEEFEAVALVHLDRVYAMARRLGRTRTEAEDLVQETYVRAVAHFDQFRPGSNCRAWLLAILHNTFVNRVTREGREVLEPDEAELDRRNGDVWAMTAPIADPAEELARHAVGADLVRALARLPVWFREAVWLADVEDCSYKEIAGICGVPIGTVMSRLSRGRRLLRRELTAAGEGPFRHHDPA